LIGKPSGSVCVKVPGRANRDRLGIVDGVFDEGRVLFVVVREDVGWDRVNCQLYSGWCLGKRKPRVITDGEGLVDAAGEGIEVWGVRLCWGVGVGAREGNSTSIINLCDEAFREEAVRLGEGGGSYVLEGGGYALGKGVGSGFGSGGEEGS